MDVFSLEDDGNELFLTQEVRENSNSGYFGEESEKARGHVTTDNVSEMRYSDISDEEEGLFSSSQVASKPNFEWVVYCYHCS